MSPSSDAFRNTSLSWRALVEARTGGLAFHTRNRSIDDGYIYYLAGTDRLIQTSVVPGDQVRLEVNIINLRSHWMTRPSVRWR